MCPNVLQKRSLWNFSRCMRTGTMAKRIISSMHMREMRVGCSESNRALISEYGYVRSAHSIFCICVLGPSSLVACRHSFGTGRFVWTFKVVASSQSLVNSRIIDQSSGGRRGPLLLVGVSVGRWAIGSAMVRSPTAIKSIWVCIDSLNALCPSTHGWYFRPEWSKDHRNGGRTRIQFHFRRILLICFLDMGFSHISVDIPGISIIFFDTFQLRRIFKCRFVVKP